MRALRASWIQCCAPFITHRVTNPVPPHPLLTRFTQLATQCPSKPCHAPGGVRLKSFTPGGWGGGDIKHCVNSRGPGISSEARWLSYAKDEVTCDVRQELEACYGVQRVSLLSVATLDTPLSLQSKAPSGPSPSHPGWRHDRLRPPKARSAFHKKSRTPPSM